MKVSSYTAGGMSSSTMGAMTVSISSTNANVKKTSRNEKRMPRKALNYNPREISSAILRASKARSAGQVLVQAKGKLSALAKAKGSGQYNEAEVNVAIAHAKRMVRCAQMKTQNLRQEELIEKRYEKQVRAETRQEKNESRTREIQKERNLQQKQEIANTQYNQRQKKLTRDLLQKKKANRNREQNKVAEADMDYLKQQTKELRQPYSSATGCSPMDGVTLELSQNGMGLSDAQLEQQMDAMIDSSMAGAAGTGTEVSGTGMPNAAVNIGI